MRDKRIKIIIYSYVCFASLVAQQVPLEYYGRESFLIEGTSIADSLKESPYDRLPVSYKSIVREPVWDLSKNSAGLSIRFNTNSTLIRVRWEVLNDESMNHMTETGIKGVDLYFNNSGFWQYVGSGRPYEKIKNNQLIIEKMKSEMREYNLYLPLYDGIESLEIGIDSLSIITKPRQVDR
ncbi:MAG: SGNH/GDSL hydrolase N-terminal domain-containing protein [Candidatus Neomarinimicrobiota bacterium]